ncbi:MAG: DUF2029 domain-containing protein [Alphaproteobacteria bacterium]|jgi:hypothetical protein|nr:DUF2029 domain-containing protein [Alphaproteobacteria bacterium]
MSDRKAAGVKTESLAEADRHWLIARRVRVYPRIIVAAYLIFTAALVLLSKDLIDPLGRPLGADFITFWASSHLTLNGDPAAAFDGAKILAAERVAVPANEKLFLWHYPPMFMLVVMPLSLVPYLLSFLVWNLLTLAAFVAAMRKIAPVAATVWLTLAFGGTYVNFIHGQTGFLTAALFGGSIVMLGRRPVLAGILIGLLCYKPHLGILLPLALICGRHWSAFLAASVTTIAFALTSVAVVGLESWRAFFENIPLVRLVFEEGMLPWVKMPGFFPSLRLLGADTTVAYALHGVLALAVAAIVAWVWWRKTPIPLAAAVLVTGTLLVTPYSFDYDLVLLAIPVALLGWDGYRNGWMSWEREILVLAGVVPVITPLVAEITHLQIGFLILLAMFAVATRRAAASGRTL